MWLLFRAEWRKMAGNRWVVGCLVWLFPIAAALVALGLLLYVAVSPSQRQHFAENPSTWTDASLFFWAVPNSIFGRLLIIGFTAALFGGEYQWGTWKTLLPRRSRPTLILMKFLALSVFILLAFTLTSLIWVVGLGLVQLASGASYPPALDAIPTGYWGELALQVSTAFLSTLILAALAALVALVTRSILASIIIGLGAAIIDGVVAAVLILLYLVTDWRLFPNLWRFTVSYNVDNLLNWATAGEAVPLLNNINIQDNPVFGDFVLDPPLAGNALGVSLLVLVVWMVVLVALAVFSFYRQDLTS